MFTRFVVSSEKLRATIVGRMQALADVTQPLEAAGALSRDAAVVRIRDEGLSIDPPWIPSRKTQFVTMVGRYGGTYTMQGSGGRTGFDTGNMERSIAWEITGPGEVKTGTNVPYARDFQFGTGELGVGPHAGRSSWTIFPNAKQALSWTFGGRRFFAKSVTQHGQPPRPFLFFDQNLIDAIKQIFASYVAGRR